MMFTCCEHCRTTATGECAFLAVYGDHDSGCDVCHPGTGYVTGVAS